MKTINKKFTKRLTEYLESECGDYDLKYDWEYDADSECCHITIGMRYSQNIKELNFKYDEAKDDLSIELSEDSYYVTREFDYTVKYFWMLISPTLFPNN